ncbi:SusC/RagA family TonB-linked outer membrane protein [Zobellia barbeyronii]|uniref:TonB-dependent receptor n=2 Tax=Zobellia TaxID=112040 RepID=A0ABS5W8F0_9FLAO|nr:TonB-dependent receptor [Zobellia barbeyronii]MBT2159677.1 TonB-dependent receptor [Zobellia barbeyronii]
MKKTQKKTNPVRRKSFRLLILLCLSFSWMHAQEITVTGKITSSDDSMPLPGANVVVKGTSVGVTSDFDGLYSINVPQGGTTLIFSYIGYKNTEIAISGKTTINADLEIDASELDEVVVIGFGTVKKKELTGAVSQVKAEAIKEFVTPDLGSALQGQIAGVNITASSGEPGAQSNIQIRGITSLSGSNTPLFVVDGIPQQGDPRLSPNEIETIDVLKDAASAAVYGTRGAAGVILITTKRGKEGSMKVDFDHTYGIQRLGSGTPIMNTEDQLYFETQQNNYFPEAFSPGPARPEWLNNDNDFTDFVLVDHAESQTYGLNVSGGASGFTYNVVGGYFSADGVLTGSNFKRYNGRATTTYNTDNWKIDASVGYILEDNKRATDNLLTNAIRYRPYFPILDQDSDVFYIEEGNGGVTTPLNTVAQNIKRRDRERTDKINASLSVTRNIAEGLNFTSRIGTNVTNTIRNIFRPKFELIDIATGFSEVDPLKSGVSAEASRLSTFSWDGSLNYKKSFGNHNIDALVSSSFDERNFQSFLAGRNGVVSNAVQVLNGSSQDQTADSGFNYVRKNVGFLGRLQYNYKGKYLLSVLARRDASSKFGKDFRWGTFPSISAAWNVSDEGFWKNLLPTINNFKIRASQGTVGNDSFGDYVFASTVSQERDYIFDENDLNVTLGSAIVQYANPSVKWETSVSNNIGIDLGFFNNKFTLTADYYVTNKEDMLFPIRLPGSTGVVNGQPQNVTLNIGDMTNKGLEIGANYRANLGQSTLSMGATFTKNRNEITRMAEGNDLIFNPNAQLLGSPVTVFVVGREAAAFYLHQTNGTIKNEAQLEAYKELDINARLGDLMYTDQPTVDTNNDGIPDAGDGVINDNDRVYSGSGLPDFELGFNLNWAYKNFDLSMNWYASVGAEILNGTKADAMTRGRHQNLVNMWTPDNTSSNIPFYIDRAGRHPNYNGDTDLWIENGDYFRLKLVSLGYTLPADVSEKIGMNKLRLFVSAQNPLTLTGYDGYDPEVGGGNIAQRGLDLSKFPLTQLYSLGVNISF